MRRLAGYCLFSVPFILLFAICVVDIGWRQALIAWAIALGILAVTIPCIVVAERLIHRKTEHP